jgi:uridine kinase
LRGRRAPERRNSRARWPSRSARPSSRSIPITAISVACRSKSALLAHLGSLAGGGEAEIPVYDFTRHLRTDRTETVRAGQFGVLEGLWTLYWEDLRRLLRTKVYVDTADRVCFERRLARDIGERGRSAESVAARYAAMTRPMARRYVLPERRFADLVVSGVQPIEESVKAVRALLGR